MGSRDKNGMQKETNIPLVLLTRSVETCEELLYEEWSLNLGGSFLSPGQENAARLTCCGRAVDEYGEGPPERNGVFWVFSPAIDKLLRRG